MTSEDAISILTEDTYLLFNNAADQSTFPMTNTRPALAFRTTFRTEIVPIIGKSIAERMPIDTMNTKDPVRASVLDCFSKS